MNDSHDNAARPNEIMLFAASAADAQRFAEQMNRLGHAPEQTQAGGIAAAIVWSRNNPPPGVLLVDIDGDPLPLQSISELIEVCDPGCQIIALGSTQDVNLYRTLIHSGVFDYLVKPVPLDLLAATLNRARNSGHLEAPGARSGRTIAVTGVSGGSGCSTIAAGLAQLLSEQRHTATALVDFDRTHGDQALLLGYDGDAGLGGALASGEIDSRFLQRSMGRINERLHLLAQEPNLRHDHGFSSEHLLTLGASLCRMFNQVIWDLPASRPHGALDVLAHAQTRIVLTDFNVQDARKCHRLLHEIGDESEGQHLLLVANPSRSAQAGILDRQQFEDFVERRIDLVLPHAGQHLSNSLLTGPLRLATAPVFQSSLLDLADQACGHTPRKVEPATGSIITRLKLALGRNRKVA